MAKEEKVQSGGGSSGGSFGGSSGGSSSGSFSGSSSKGGSSSSKSSSLGSSKVSGGKSVSSAGSNARAAIQAGRAGALASRQASTANRVYGSSQKSFVGTGVGGRANSTAASPLTHYSQRGNAPSMYDPNVSAQEKINERKATLDSEASVVADEANFLAEASGGKRVNASDTYYGEAVANTANELISRWDKGEAVTAAVENGKVVVKNEENDVNRKHYWVDVDENGNDIATQNPERQRQNNEMFAQDVQNLLDLYNSGNYTKEDVLKSFIGIKKWDVGLKDGTWVPPTDTLEDGTSVQDYLNELWNMRGEMLANVDRRDAGQIIDSFNFKGDDLVKGFQPGVTADPQAIQTDIDEISAYAKKYQRYEDVSQAFSELLTRYQNLAYASNRHNYDELVNAEAKAKQNYDDAVAAENKFAIGTIDGDADPDAWSRAKQDMRDAEAAWKDAKSAVGEWVPNTNEERDALIAKMHGNAGFLKGGLTAEEQARLRELDNELGNPYINYGSDYTRWGAVPGNVLKQGGAGIARMGSATLNFVVNGVPKVFDGISSWLVDKSDFARDVDALVSEMFQPVKETANWFETGIGAQQEKYQQEGFANVSGNEVAELINKYGPEVIQMIPMAMAAAATGGAVSTSWLAQNGAAGAAFGATQFGDTIAAASSVAQASGIEQLALAIGNSLKTKAADPNFQLTFLQELGGNYNEAIADGASDGEAVMYALLCSYLNSEIEIGDGLQTLPDDVQDAIATGKKDVLMAWAKSTWGEGLEEIQQGGVSALLKGVYQPVVFASSTNEDAVINPRRMLEEGIGGAVGGGVLGGVTAVPNLIRAPKGSVSIGKNGQLVVNDEAGVDNIRTRAVTKGKNRHDTATNVLAEGFENAGYVNSTNEDEDYNIATTGMENRPLSAEEADQQSHDQMLEEEGKRQVEAAAEEEARKAQEEKNAENAKLDEESKRREREIEGARQAAKAFQDEQDAQLRAAQEADRLAASARAAREFQAEQDFIRQAEQARQAAEEAGRKAEEQMAIAESQSRTLEGQEQSVASAPVNQEQQNRSLAGSQEAALEAQNQNVASAPVNQERQNQAIAASQTQTIEGQDTNPVQAPKNTEAATATETAQGEAQASTQAQTPDNTQEAVKLEENAQGEGSRAVATAEQGKAAIESGETNNKTVAEVIPMVDKHISEQDAVSDIPENVFADSPNYSKKTKLSDRVASWFKNRFPSGSVKASAVGSPVIIAKRGIKNDVAHGLSDAKVATFAAIPDILDKGMVVSQSDGSVKDKSVTVAGKVMLYGEPVNVYCVVKKNSGNNRFYLHEVSDGNGTVYYQIDNSNKKNATPALQDSTGMNPASADVTSDASIAQPAQNDNGKMPDGMFLTVEQEKALAEADERQRKYFEEQANNPENYEWFDFENEQADVAPDYYNDPQFQQFVLDLGAGSGDVDPETGFDPYETASELWEQGIHSTNELQLARQNGTIKAERSEQNDSIESGSVPEGNTGTVDRTRDGSESGASSRLQEVLEDSRGDAATHTDLRTANAPVLKKEDAQPEVQSLADWSEEQTGEECRLHNASGFPNANAGSSYAKGEGISAAAIHPGTRRTENGIVGGAGTTIVHETVHKKVQQLGIKAADVLDNAYQKIKATEEQINKTYSMVCWAYGRYYAQGQGSLSEVTTEQWNDMSPAERKAAIDALPENVRDIVNDKIAEETLCFFISRDAQLGKYEGTYTIAEASREAAVEASLFSANAFDNIDSKMQMANLVSLMQAQNAAQTQQQTQKKTGVTPGKEKVTQSAAEKQMATKGEGATTDAAMGEATYISRTNAARSETADHLTNTQEKADAQTQRLLEDGYTWTDDDVVIAQKLMFDMIKSIRDYQMHRAGKMNTAAFRTLTEQYNKLMTKHQQMLSEAGQKLQANYMFSDGDKIIMKAAQTFLGFTKDGRFAGAAPNAKNAKIYAGIEEAVKRISIAIEAKDTQSLAKICKDISNIRNVKKMFGPLGKFADEMETRVLDKVSNGENAAANLEKLAYGNLNAVCDDVQPYKALNAAKTIRVMNMLSNTATIVNNLANNFAQGAVSRSMVNQAFNQLAAKPFEALTGQKILSTTQRGKTAQKAVHNAKVEALEAATLMQMYGISENNGRLELNDRGMFNPNINAFEQTMSLYKFLTGMGVEATDQMQAAGFLKEMELGIDEDIKAGKIAAHTREQRMQEARHEVNRLLYKDDNATTALVQHFRDFLNKWSIGNEKTGTIGLGDITMAFAKIPANVVRARLAMTPEGALLQLAQYAKGVNKAKRMHAEVLANNIAQKYSSEMEKYRNTLNALYETEPSQERTKAINAVKSKISAINNQMWAEAREQCRGSVFRNLETIRNNYNENMPYDEAVERAGYTNAKEMSQFEAAQLSRKIGRAATSAGMMALGSVLRALGGLRDFDQEPDDELRKMNKDKGYQGLMFNAYAMFRPGHEWKDGDLVLDGEFLEVVAMPLTIGATAAEAAATAQDAKTWAWLKSMAGNGIAKTFEAVGDIPGMADAINMYESMTSAYTTDYDEKVSRLKAGLLNYAANTVPSFFMPNSVSQAAAGLDNTVRDVYTTDSPWEQAKNIFMNKFPVLRNKIPASVDVWGNERDYGEGLWGAVNKMLLPGDVRVYRKNKYETEIERLVKEGYANATPKTTVNSSFEIGDEKYTMTAQEKRDFKLGRNQQQRQLYEAFMDSDYYDQLTDAERMKVFKALKTSAERDAKQTMLNDRQLNVQVTRDRWETELTDINDQIQFLAAKQMANDVLDRDVEDMDYKAVDNYLTGAYKKLNETQRELLDSTYSRLDDMYEAKSKYGIGSEMWQKGYDIYKDYMSDDGKARVQGGYKDWEGSQMYTDIAKATGASEKQMDFFEDKFVLYNNNAVIPEKYNEFVDAGWSRDSAQALVKSIADLTPTNGRKTVSYKQRLTSIATTPNLTEAQRWEAFYEYCPSSYTSVIRRMSREKSNGTSYEKALKAAGKWDK